MSGTYRKNELRSTIDLHNNHKTGKKPERGLKALASGSLAIARFHTILDKTEKQLELELERENRAPPQTLIGKARRKGETVLHSKQVLFCVIILNVIDCILVLGELILDMYYVKGLLESSQGATSAFITDMKTLYPVDLSSINIYDVQPLYHNLLHAHIEWDHFTHIVKRDVSESVVKPGCNPNLTSASPVIAPEHSIEKRSADNSTDESDTLNNTIDDHDNDTVNTQLNNDHSDNSSTINHDNFDSNNETDDHHDVHTGHSVEEEIAHAFHKASITILAILAVENLCKIFFYGMTFLEKRLEVFDCVIVFGSLFVDIYFLNGISAYKIQEFVIILAFLVPWRVIRVVNSLVVAVIDHEHFRLKLLYKQKKEVSNELKKTKTDVKTLQQAVDIVKKIAIDAGIPEQKIAQHLAMTQQIMGKQKKKGVLNFGHSFPLFNSSPKSSPNLRLRLDANANANVQDQVDDVMHDKSNEGDNTSCNTVSTHVTDTVLNISTDDVNYM